LEQVFSIGTQSDVHKLCELLAPVHLDRPTAEAIEEATTLVATFLSGIRGRQIAASPNVRELEFLLPWPTSGGNSGRYLHGFMDCLYQDAQGDWHLLDYKSNQVTAEGVPAVAQSYEMQMFVYSLACERALGKWPIESTLCFVRPNVEYSFVWTPEQQIRLAAKLDGAIAEILSGNATVSPR
jgi:ATP-dependent exoDNAse (exonuclease V) beta subunit